MSETPGYAWVPGETGWLVCRRCGWWSALIVPRDAEGKAAMHDAQCPDPAVTADVAARAVIDVPLPFE